MEDFSTKLKGDIAEYRVIAELLRRGHEVLQPCGDRLPYDLAVVQSGALRRIQVKMAWRDQKRDYWCVDIRRHQTNRRRHLTSKYDAGDFDYLIAWVPAPDTFYVFPSADACSYASCITLVDQPKKIRARSEDFKGRWDLLS